ncbi:hypothetical protein C8R45DRAFT_1212993 [Mycena sanguinolenta]|nr:hypothetical protein C8R45DRAFT_1212993 [Mycena sanguinolenta]
MYHYRRHLTSPLTDTSTRMLHYCLEAFESCYHVTSCNSIGAKLSPWGCFSPQNNLFHHNTPISGFYGPGGWPTWLVTLGMTQFHMGVRLLTTGDISEYDLIGQSDYTAGRRSQRVAALSGIALRGTRRLDWDWHIVIHRITALGFVRSPAGRLGPGPGIAVTPLFFTLVASWFTVRTHEAVARTAPVI